MARPWTRQRCYYRDAYATAHMSGNHEPFHRTETPQHDPGARASSRGRIDELRDEPFPVRGPFQPARNHFVAATGNPARSAPVRRTCGVQRSAEAQELDAGDLPGATR